MIIYHYDRENCIYTGHSSEARKCPKTGVDIFPNASTTIEPPVFNETEMAIFDEYFEEWIVVEKGVI